MLLFNVPQRATCSFENALEESDWEAAPTSLPTPRNGSLQPTGQ